MAGTVKMENEIKSLIEAETVLDALTDGKEQIINEEVYIPYDLALLAMEQYLANKNKTS